MKILLVSVNTVRVPYCVYPLGLDREIALIFF